VAVSGSARLVRIWMAIGRDMAIHFCLR
jgi:hypothetical protein